MKIGRFIKYYLFGNSLKKIEVDRILEKIDRKSILTNRERSFINLYNQTNNEFTDYMYVSKNFIFRKVSELLSLGKSVICDLHDKNGKIGIEITDLTNNIEEDECSLKLKDGGIHFLHDRFLYNLVYNIKKDRYSLQEQDEYFEKIENKK